MPGATHRPLVRFLVHGAERSGPPIYLLRLLRAWQQHPPAFQPEVVLARPGPLQPDFAAAAPTWCARLDRRSPERLSARAADALHAPGLGAWITRRGTIARGPAHPAEVTVVNGATGPTVELLRAFDPDGPVLTIAHELSTGWFCNLTPGQRSDLLDRTERFLAVSRSVESFLVDALGVAAHRIEVIHPPVDLGEVSADRAPAPAAARPQTVVGAGMTDWRKAPESWLRVARSVKDQLHPETVRFVWFGGSTTGDPGFWPVQHEIQQLGMTDEVEFLGQVDDPARILIDADVFLTTAREDAFPLACAEALACGTPVVGFAVDGVAEMVNVSGGGRLADYPDEPGLAARVVDLLGDADRRAELGELGRAYGRSHLDVKRLAPTVAAWIGQDTT